MAASSYRPSSASHTHSVPSTSATVTQPENSIPVLRLRATGPTQRRQLRIQWAEDVVDNEGLGRKRSKVCCIYHAPHAVGESSSESSSDSDSSDGDSEPGNDDGKARMGGKGAARKGSPAREPDEDENGCEHDHGRGKSPKKKGKAARKQRKPNAYEAVPHVKSKAPGERS